MGKKVKGKVSAAGGISMTEGSNVYMKLLKAIPDPLFYCDKNGVLLGSNDELKKILCKTEKQIVNRNIKEILPEELSGKCIKAIEELLVNRKRLKLDFETVDFLKEKCGVTLHLALYDSGKDAAPGIICTLTGLRASDVDRCMLRQKEGKHCPVLDSLKPGIWMVDSENILIYVNEILTGILGYTREELLGVNLKKITGVDNFTTNSKSLKGNNSEKQMLYKLKLLKKNNDSVLTQIYKSELSTGKSGLNVSIGVVVDISGQKTRERRLHGLQMQEMLNALSLEIDNDFSDILSVIQGNVSLARELLKDNERVSKYLDEAQIAVCRADSMIEKLIANYITESTVMETRSIESLLRDTAEILLDSPSIEYNLDIDDNLVGVDLDKDQIMLIFSSLLRNALQAMPDGGKIELRAKKTIIKKSGKLNLLPGDYLKISVIDNGIGIPAANLERIYDPYFTTYTDRKGLGLTLAYMTVKNYDGTIKVKSQDGKGSSFDVYLPLSGRVKSRLRFPAAKSLHRQIRVLVMDDERSVREISRKILETFGYYTETVLNGEDMLKIYSEYLEKSKPFDVVLMDLKVSCGMGGKEAIIKLLEMDPKAKAIAFSGYSDDEVMANYSKYGFKGKIKKPTTAVTINNAIVDVLKEDS